MTEVHVASHHLRQMKPNSARGRSRRPVVPVTPGVGFLLRRGRGCWSNTARWFNADRKLHSKEVRVACPRAHAPHQPVPTSEPLHRDRLGIRLNLNCPAVDEAEEEAEGGCPAQVDVADDDLRNQSSTRTKPNERTGRRARSHAQSRPLGCRASVSTRYYPPFL
jgi:hypothetical protein